MWARGYVQGTEECHARSLGWVGAPRCLPSQPCQVVVCEALHLAQPCRDQGVELTPLAWPAVSRPGYILPRG